MKKILIAAGLVSAAAASYAAVPDSVYVKAEAGPAFVQDVNIKDSGGVKARFDVGARADVAVGYQFNPCWAAELEGGVVWNQVDRIGTEVPPPPPTSTGGVYEKGKADLYRIPLLVNAVYNLPIGNDRLKCFVGAGAGGMASVLDARFITAKVNDTDFTFAYQAFAGIKYAINDHVEIGAEYKFLGTPDHDWNEHAVKVKTDEIFTHAVMAALTFHF